jgi:hypothetical protein
MKKTRLPIALSFLCLIALPSFAGSADEEGFVSLFNGRDLTGWRGNTHGYTVKEGMLCGDETVRGALYTDREFENFILRFEFRLHTNTNNGLGIRFPEGTNPAYGGMELQILDDTGPIYEKFEDWQYHGGIYGVVGAKRGALNPTGEWNFQEVRAEGSRIKVVLNGREILNVDVKDFQPPFPDGKPHPGLHNSKGLIGWLGHKSPIEIRNIRIKELPPTP